ncbi:MAG: membrane fusion protein, multidrug efflux system [Azoarcus sp.]|uniref:Membrane fusion protein, multidrug efflux system n=1 Tax=Aromatoleum tolulyticum TaxID=34027 RepID=A0A1N6RMZ3_9RHOO|nr:efflux RND transporter periplasmic adaptor subunit [Aromatoleum tolulyticum]MCK9984420.1 membrane fusion protein, multidrug efflux system [Azoarcus sp.]SIQ30244.1 membrane fusion protein, multidrug efflux system [Aromatoleum tolulyticum]
MPARRRLIAAVSLAGLAALAGYAYYANRSVGTVQPVAGAKPAAGANAPAAQGPAEVETVTVLAEAMADDVTAVGTLRSNESVVLRPEVAGRIDAIRFREGGPVRRGDVLVDFDAAVQRAEVQQAKANLALAQANFGRTEDLFNRKFLSQSARDEAASRLEVARANMALAEARLDKMRIRAPFAGIVGIRNVSVGDYVKEGEDLVNLEDIATLKVDFRLPETYLAQIRPGQKLELASDAVAGRLFTAVVSAIDPLVDEQGRAVVMRATLQNEGLGLRPGMFARVRLILEERANVAVVPEEVLVPAPGDVQFVYRVVDGKAQRVEVKTGARRGARVEIVKGVQAGDVVVTAGQLKLRDGAAVKIVGAGGAQVAPAAGSAKPAS